MNRCRAVRNGGASSQRGQALIEMILTLPFFILLLMILAEFGIFFYKSNLIENTTQQIGRMAARGASYDDLNTYMNDHLSAFSAAVVPPALEVLNEDGADVSATGWNSDDALEVKISATVKPVMPVDVFNIFAPTKDFIPDQFTLEARKKVYVE